MYLHQFLGNQVTLKKQNNNVRTPLHHTTPNMYLERGGDPPDNLTAAVEALIEVNNMDTNQEYYLPPSPCPSLRPSMFNQQEHLQHLPASRSRTRLAPMPSRGKKLNHLERGRKLRATGAPNKLRVQKLILGHKSRAAAAGRLRHFVGRTKAITSKTIRTCKSSSIPRHERAFNSIGCQHAIARRHAMRNTRSAALSLATYIKLNSCINQVGTSARVED
ncbi:hypothetical protein EVAR_85442_1 [Eumeta japonica]|uniref:Uncharacterized protein n=1 Tax=Eumeta variegata TaxID=151549 RepID=A0A4C1WK56_EUMVA|nr:hypothetical protein EVAR_85442_1 [Eumeta japonica]